jgi:hypothetical protein
MAARPIAGIDEPIVWLLLREGVAANGYTGDTARAWGGIWASSP